MFSVNKYILLTIIVVSLSVSIYYVQVTSSDMYGCVYHGIGVNECNSMVRVGESRYYNNVNAAIDSVGDSVSKYVLQYLRENHQEIYNAIIGANATHEVREEPIQLILDEDNVVRIYNVTWRDPQNFSVTVKVYLTSNETVLFGGFELRIDNVYSAYAIELNKTLEDKLRSIVWRQFYDLDPFAVRVTTGEDVDSNETHVRDKVFAYGKISIKDTPIAFLLKNESDTTPIYLPKVAFECIRIMRDEELVKIIFRLQTDYLLIKHLIDEEKVVLKSPSIVETKARFNAMQYLGAHGISTAEAEITVELIALWYGNQFKPAYLVEIKTQDRVYKVLVDGVRGSILKVSPMISGIESSATLLNTTSATQTQSETMDFTGYLIFAAVLIVIIVIIVYFVRVGLKE